MQNDKDSDYYIDEEGFVVFTEHYHLRRGYCCGRGCKHCPYNYENVPDVKREWLLKERKKNERKSK